MTVRSVHPEEEKQARRVLDWFGDGLWERIGERGELRVLVRPRAPAEPPAKGARRRAPPPPRDAEKGLVLVTRDLLRAHAPLDPLHMGVEVGHWEENAFRLSIGGVTLLGEIAERRTVVVAEKGEQLFLYGRDLFGPSVLRHDPDLRPGLLCLVRNGRGDCLGLGQVTGPFRTESTCVKNVLDLGVFLRVPEEF